MMSKVTKKGFSNNLFRGGIHEQHELICDTCGERLGEHFGTKCPKEVIKPTKVIKKVALFVDARFDNEMVATESMGILDNIIRISEYVEVEFTMLEGYKAEVLKKVKRHIEAELVIDTEALEAINKRLVELLKEERG